MLLTGEAVLVWDQGVQGTLYFLLSTQYCCEPKAALKNKSVFGNKEKKVYLAG